MRTAIEDNTEATAVAAHHHHHQQQQQQQQHRGAIDIAAAAAVRHLRVEQQERSAATPIHLATATPYHQITIAADTNNNHDHHRNLEQHAAQHHEHWNKCKSEKQTNRGAQDHPDRPVGCSLLVMVMVVVMYNEDG